MLERRPGRRKGTRCRSACRRQARFATGNMDEAKMSTDGRHPPTIEQCMGPDPEDDAVYLLPQNVTEKRLRDASVCHTKLA